MKQYIRIFMLVMLSSILLSCEGQSIEKLNGNWEAKRKSKVVATLQIDTKGKTINIERNFIPNSDITNFSGMSLGDGKYETKKGELTYNNELDVIYFINDEYTRVTKETLIADLNNVLKNSHFKAIISINNDGLVTGTDSKKTFEFFLSDVDKVGCDIKGSIPGEQRFNTIIIMKESKTVNYKGKEKNSEIQSFQFLPIPIDTKYNCNKAVEYFERLIKIYQE